MPSPTPNLDLSAYLLSPNERRQRHELLGAMNTLQSAITELQKRVTAEEPKIDSRNILLESDRALGTLKNYLERQFKPFQTF